MKKLPTLLLIVFLLFANLILSSTEFNAAKNEFSSYEQRDLEKLNTEINYIQAKNAKDAGISVYDLKKLLEINKNLDLNAAANVQKNWNQHL